MSLKDASAEFAIIFDGAIDAAGSLGDPRDANPIPRVPVMDARPDDAQWVVEHPFFRDFGDTPGAADQLCAKFCDDALIEELIGDVSDLAGTPMPFAKQARDYRPAAPGNGLQVTMNNGKILRNPRHVKDGYQYLGVFYSAADVAEICWAT